MLYLAPRSRFEKAQKNAVSMDLTVEQSVTAPVSQGQRLGTLTVKAGDQILKEILKKENIRLQKCKKELIGMLMEIIKSL